MPAVNMTVLDVVAFGLLLLLASVSAQYASTGVCSRWSEGTCVYANQPCPPGKMLLQNAPTTAPWLCGGWYKVCCVKDPNYVGPTSTPSAINETDCGLGTPTSRILRGKNTSVCDWPYVVSIRGRVKSNVALSQTTTQHACAGVLIDKYWVLTHAICLYTTNKQPSEVANELLVVAGEYNTAKIDLDPRYQTGQQLEQFVPVAQGFVNPGFTRIQYLSDLNLVNNQLTNNNAVALLKLAQPVNNNCASAACLPHAAPLKANSCDTFSQCVILGWGFTSQYYNNTDRALTQGFVKIYKNDVCDFLQTRVFASGPARFTKSACQVSNYNQGACLGDQGGPVLCYDGSRWSVQGIIPFNMCKDGKVNPYVLDVASYDTWIYNTIKNSP